MNAMEFKQITDKSFISGIGGDLLCVKGNVRKKLREGIKNFIKDNNIIVFNRTQVMPLLTDKLTEHKINALIKFDIEGELKSIRFQVRKMTKWELLKKKLLK